MRLNGNTSLNGVINVYKEKNFTSHDVVAVLRKILNIKKIGHAGTLDPNVTGVLPICVGSSTKISSYLMENPKTYIGEINFGFETDTEDIWGNIINKTDHIPSLNELQTVLNSYDNTTILQTPPMYSSVKIKGKKLYELARDGKEIERKTREVVIYNIQLIRFKNTRAHIKVTCSKGTYIRTLFKDISRKCHSLGTMSSLVRISSGGLNIKNSISLEQIKQLYNQGLNNFVISPEIALANIPKLKIPDFLFEKAINGMAIKTNLIDLTVPDGEYMVFCNNSLIGIYQNEYNKLKLKTYLYRGNQ